MHRTWKRTAVLCLALAAVATAGAAQDRPPGPGPGGRGFDRAKMMEAMRMRHETMLHDVLSIKPDQEAAFHAYLTAIAPPHRDHPAGGAPGAKPPMPPAPMTTPERLDRMAARMAERQTRFQQTAAATKTFYAALSPEQRRAFDALPMMMHGGGHERGGPMGGHHTFGGPR